MEVYKIRDVSVQFSDLYGGGKSWRWPVTTMGTQISVKGHADISQKGSPDLSYGNLFIADFNEPVLFH